MDVSVVIPAYNAKAALKILLLSLGHCRVGPEDKLEVVVVDDGSTDGTLDMLSALHTPLRLTVVHLPRTDRSGRAAARNAGIRRASGELIVMVDADQIVQPDFLAAHIRAHGLSKELVAVGPRSDIEDHPIDPEAFAVSYQRPAVIGTDNREPLFAEFSANMNNLATCWHYLFTCNASVRRDHVLAVGGFDETFTGWGLEDSELGYRLRQRGLAFAYLPDAVLYHSKKQVITTGMYQQWRRNLSYFISKYDTPEVAAQSILDPGLNRGIDPWEGTLRFEFACRALQGRLPRTTSFDVIEVNAGNTGEVLRQLADRAAGTDVLVIDHTAEAALAEAVQCTRTQRELLYFHCRRPGQRDRVIRRYDSGGSL